MKIRAMAATAARGKLAPFEFTLGPIAEDQIDIAVESCGICHSDLSMLNNEWGMAQFPLVPGHEVSGKVAAIGSHVKHLKVGQRVGLGWYSGCCSTCRQCLGGDQNLCPTAEATMIGRHGGFATHVRAQATWATPLPDSLDAAKAGPLFCGGITAFNPFVQFDIRPTQRVGVVGIGGLGHLALQFANKWGCEVVAFTSSPAKAAEAKSLGAHEAVTSTDDKALSALAGRFDMILVTANVPLNWPLYINALAPRGRLHFVGAVPEPVPVAIFPMLLAQRSLSGSPLGSPATTADMINFCARHKVSPVTEHFPLSKVNDALERLHSGKARYRVVLTNDLN